MKKKTCDYDEKKIYENEYIYRDDKNCPD